jgi:hypothetical protein
MPLKALLLLSVSLLLPQLTRADLLVNYSLLSALRMNFGNNARRPGQGLIVFDWAVGPWAFFDRL